MESPAPAAESRFATLDLMRGLAAMAIVTRHFPWTNGQPIMLPRDYLAVDLFFGLSGFVLAHAYGGRLSRGGAWASFMRMRLIRLYPLYLAGTLAAALIWGLILLSGQPTESSPPGASALLLSLAFLPALGSWDQPPYPFVGPAWSLFWELVAGAVFAAVAPRLNNRRLTLLVALGLGLLVISCQQYGSLDTGAYWGNFWGGGARVAFSFFMGVAIYRLRAYSGPIARLPGWFLAAVMLASFLPPSSAGGGYDLLATAILFPTLILLGADATASAAINHIGIRLGAWSYALYVIHGPMVGPLKLLSLRLTGRPLADWGVAGMVVLVALSLLMAALLEYGVDRPVRAWLNRTLSSRSFRTPRAAASLP